MITTPESIDAALPLSEIAMSMRADGFTDAEVAVGQADYRRLLVLISETGQTLRPTKLADEVLHRHLAMARFDADCRTIVGFEIDHVPHGEETAELTALKAQTTALWLARFGFEPGASNDNGIGADGASAHCCVTRKPSAAFAHCCVTVKIPAAA